MTSPLQLASRAAATLRPLYLPLGVLAVALVGLHRGADRLDDLLLGWLGALDAWFDGAAAAGLGLLGAVAAVPPAASDEWAMQAAELFPLEAHAAVARAAALLVELVAAALLAVPLVVGGPRAGAAIGWDAPSSLRPRMERASATEARQEWLRRLGRIVADPSLRKLALPVAAVAAALAGAIAAGGELEAQLLGGLARLGLPGLGGVAQLCGWMAAGLVAVQLAPEALVRAIAFADERGRRARAKGASRFQRLAAGVFVTGIALPLALAGLAHGLPR